jgi:hypothetical protein
VAVRKDWKQRKELKEAPAPRGRIPQGLGPRERMERKLLTKRGMKLYKKRACIVEPVSGQIKRCINGGSVKRERDRIRTRRVESDLRDPQHAQAVADAWEKARGRGGEEAYDGGRSIQSGLKSRCKGLYSRTIRCYKLQQ